MGWLGKSAVVFFILLIFCRASQISNETFFASLPEGIRVDYIDAETLIKFDNKGEIMMGVSDEHCDNARINLATDFDPENRSIVEQQTKCYDKLWPSDPSVKPVLTIMKLPHRYVPIHKCMHVAIRYIEHIPSIGPHRPLWARYGEYKYCPTQRWLHNVEHGAIVGLYHPCADPNEVLQMKSTITKCVYRHVITPYPKLSPERPIAIVGWTASLEMAIFNATLARNFIKMYARTGPEHVFRDGQYNRLLVKPASIVSTIFDKELCPGY